MVRDGVNSQFPYPTPIHPYASPLLFLYSLHLLPYHPILSLTLLLLSLHLPSTSPLPNYRPTLHSTSLSPSILSASSPTSFLLALSLLSPSLHFPSPALSFLSVSLSPISLHLPVSLPSSSSTTIYRLSSFPLADLYDVHRVHLHTISPFSLSTSQN